MKRAEIRVFEEGDQVRFRRFLQGGGKEVKNGYSDTAGVTYVLHTHKGGQTQAMKNMDCVVQTRRRLWSPSYLTLVRQKKKQLQITRRIRIPLCVDDLIRCHFHVPTLCNPIFFTGKYIMQICQLRTI